MKKSHSLFVFLGSKPAVGSASWALVGRVRNCFHDTTLPVVSFRETLVCNCFLNYYKKWISKQISKVGVVTLCDVMSLLCHEAFLMWLCSFTSLKVIQDVKNCKLTFWLCLFFSFLLASLMKRAHWCTKEFWNFDSEFSALYGPSVPVYK